ncbi:hypothetical protein X777_02601 [Ooceraea biroi]|uniref:Uncharacterized protein n=1 Tax=Ooceraea biroi TaxID=2015173 RepID=A0A026WMU1_OOCBI|nr:hypothetical protein X777_02601 [Ooceraea biroi]
MYTRTSSPKLELFKSFIRQPENVSEQLNPEKKKKKFGSKIWKLSDEEKKRKDG